jgi:hypothetical protein
LWVPIPLRLPLTVQPDLVTPMLQVVWRVVMRHLLDRAGLKADEGHCDAVTLIQRSGFSANLTLTHVLVARRQRVPPDVGAALVMVAEFGNTSLPPGVFTIFIDMRSST